MEASTPWYYLRWRMVDDLVPMPRHSSGCLRNGRLGRAEGAAPPYATPAGTWHGLMVLHKCPFGFNAGSATSLHGYTSPCPGLRAATSALLPPASGGGHLHLENSRLNFPYSLLQFCNSIAFTLWYGTVQYSKILYSTVPVRYRMVRCGTVQYDTVRYCTVRYGKATFG